MRVTPVIKGRLRAVLGVDAPPLLALMCRSSIGHPSTSSCRGQPRMNISCCRQSPRHVAAHVQAFLREIEVSMIAHATWRRSVQPAGCLRRKEKATLAKNTGKPAAKI